MTGHGTYTGYIKGCRCGECRAAATDYHRHWRQAHRRSVDGRSASLLPTVAEGDVSWMNRGRCRTEQVPTDVFFPNRAAKAGDAVKVCAACPVKAECLSYAVRTEQVHGVWGGLHGARLSAVVFGRGAVT